MGKRTASQIGRASRRKGKAFECWCARYFSKWTGLDWQSTRNSGRTDLKGDIYCVSRPDLPLVVECKDDKRYSVHAMLKPNKAFIDMVDHTYSKASEDDEVYIMIIVKNETGIWLSVNLNVFTTTINLGTILAENGCQWNKLQSLECGELDGVIFDANRMEAIGRRSKE